MVGKPCENLKPNSARGASHLWKTQLNIMLVMLSYDYKTLIFQFKNNMTPTHRHPRISRANPPSTLTE